MITTHSTTTIRRLNALDLDAWHHLQHEELPDPFNRGGLERELRNCLARHHGLWQHGELIGTFLGWLVIDELQVMQVVVARHARRRGIGAMLVEHALKMARAAGAITATLEVRANNRAALMLYRRCGFETDGRRRGYYPDGEDAVLMRCNLVG